MSTLDRWLVIHDQYYYIHRRESEVYIYRDVAGALCMVPVEGAEVYQHYDEALKAALAHAREEIGQLRALLASTGGPCAGAVPTVAEEVEP
jgi:hypothetical protein